MKSISCGIIITDGKKILLGKGKNNWSVPKGKMKEGETTLETALRETFEETGINLYSNLQNISIVDIFDYKPSKDIVFFIYLTNNLPDIKDMYCSTFYNDRPEMSEYKYIKVNKIDLYCNKKISKIIKQIIKE